MNAAIWVIALVLSHTSATDWEGFTTTDDIRIEYRYAHGDTLEIFAERSVQSCAAAFLHLLEDTERIQEWVTHSHKATILAQPAPNSHIVHTEFSARWPIARRDMVTRSLWFYEPKTGRLQLQIDDASEVLAASENSVRMTEVSATWTLQENPNRAMTISYQGLANPAGKIPRRLARGAALRAIRDSFLALDEILQDYQQDYRHISCNPLSSASYTSR